VNFATLDPLKLDESGDPLILIVMLKAITTVSQDEIRTLS